MAMEKFEIVAKNPEREDTIREKLEDFGFVYDDEDFDFVVAFGGDGTYLASERKYPGVPKLLVRDSMVCYKCHDESVEEVLKRISEGDYKVVENMKLEARHDGEALTAANDVVIRNKEPTRGIRFKVRAGGKESQLLIGDGVVVSTPFGSTGYFCAITRETFEDGIGVAFNNTTVKQDPWYLDADEEVEVELVRGEAHLAVDNDPELRTLEEGDIVTVRKKDEVARILQHVH